jgi:phosphoribosylanthranilate isomerase
MKTRIKICGLTREGDVDAAIAAGADAIGFVFYPASPRHVTPKRAAELARRIPPFVEVVGLFVNEEAALVRAACDIVPLSLLQFHGDEDAVYCRQFSRPYLRAARVRPGLNLVEFAGSFPDARGLLLDAFVEGYGGGGHVFGAFRRVDRNQRWRGNPACTTGCGRRLLRGRNEQGHQGSLENRRLRGGCTESR